MPQRRPAMVLVGEDPAAQVYEAGKRKDCKQCGIYYETYRLPYEVSQEELVELVQLLNQREEIDGILIQFPLPSTWTTGRCSWPSGRTRMWTASTPSTWGS